MKLLIWFRRFVNFEWRRTSSDKAEKNSKNPKIRKVVKFEDCEQVNQDFVVGNMEETHSRNQYMAALAGVYCKQVVDLTSVTSYCEVNIFGGTLKLKLFTSKCYRTRCWSLNRLGLPLPADPSVERISPLRTSHVKSGVLDWQHSSTWSTLWGASVWMVIGSSRKILGNADDIGAANCNILFYDNLM